MESFVGDLLNQLNSDIVDLFQPTTETVPRLVREIYTVDLTTPAAGFTIYTVPASTSFLPLAVQARTDTDVTATDDDYWSVGVDAAIRRVDFGVCTTAAATNKHGKNAKFHWINPFVDIASTLVAATEVIKLMSVDSIADGAELSNNIGGASEQATVVLVGWLVEDLADAP
jgi:hypothetical protein